MPTTSMFLIKLLINFSIVQIMDVKFTEHSKLQKKQSKQHETYEKRNIVSSKTIH